MSQEGLAGLEKGERFRAEGGGRRGLVWLEEWVEQPSLWASARPG